MTDGGGDGGRIALITAPTGLDVGRDIGERLRRRLWIEWAGIFILSLALIVGLSLSGATARFDNLIYDRMLAYAPADPPQDVLLITIDEASLAEYGRWPWPRAAQARLLENIAAGRPKAVGYDILLSDAGEAADDAALSAAIAQVPLQIIFPAVRAQPI